MPNDLSKEQLQRLARLGAQARLEELEAERRAIMRAFPGLAAQAARQGKPAAASAAAEGGELPVKTRGRRRKMSAAQKKAASERMKKYWSERRKAKA